jgi:hypothetical protein
MGFSDEAKNVIPLKFLRKIKNNSIFQTKVRKWFLADRRQRL